MKTPRLTALAVSVGLSLLATTAWAQPRSRFEDRYRQGNELRARHNDASALAVFESIWAESHEPRARAQIGLAEAALGRWLLAETHLVEALAAPSDEWIARNRLIIESTLGTVRARLGNLEVVCPSPGAEVWMNDRRVATLPLTQPLRVASGTVQFEVRAAGRATSFRTAVVPPSGFARETIDDLSRLPSELPPPGDAAAQRPGWTSPTPGATREATPTGILRSPWFWTAVGVVVAGGVTAGVVLATRSGEEPYSGNLSPGMVTVR